MSNAVNIYKKMETSNIISRNLPLLSIIIQKIIIHGPLFQIGNLFKTSIDAQWQYLFAII